MIWLRFRTGHEHAFLAGHAVRSACGAVVVGQPAGAFSSPAHEADEEQPETVRAAVPRAPCFHCLATIDRLRRLHERVAAAGGRR